MATLTSRRNNIVAATAGMVLAVTGIVLWQRRRQQQHYSKAGDAKRDDYASSSPTTNESKQDGDRATLLNVPENVIVLDNPQAAGDGDLPRIRTPNSVTIVHGSVTGTAQKLALELQAMLQQVLPAAKRITRVTRTDEWDWWDELLNVDEDDGARKSSSSDDGDTPILIILLPTYSGGAWPPCASTLQTALEEIQSDWRVAQFPLKRQLQVAVFGLGSSAYGDGTMGQPARQVVRKMQRLGAKLLVRLAVGDDSVGQHMQESFDTWSKQLKKVVTKGSAGNTPKQAMAKETEAQKELIEQDEYDDEEEDAQEPAVMDVEDMGDVVASQQTTTPSAEPREMVTPSQAKALKKEGYQLIGTHSAVKLCRWTKHQLRGRGGCYKHTFYGITSYQCMEATPSLACANKV